MQPANNVNANKIAFVMLDRAATRAPSQAQARTRRAGSMLRARGVALLVRACI